MAGRGGRRRSSTATRTSRTWCGRRRSRRTWAPGRYVAPRLRVATGNMLTDPLHRPSGAREPRRGLLEGARGGAEAHRGRGAQPRRRRAPKRKTTQGMTRAMTRLRSAVVAILVLAAPRLLSAQERGAVALGEAVAGLDVTARVLVIGAHPDDEDTQLSPGSRAGGRWRRRISRSRAATAGRT